jgi:hypothetical protein
MEQVKKYSPAVFAHIAFCFLLPFFNLSYQGQKVANISFLQLVIHDSYTYQKGPYYGNDGSTSYASYYFGEETFSQIALIITLLGLAIGFLKIKNKNLLLTIISISGFVIMLLLQSNLYKKLLSFVDGKFFIEYEFSYWFILLLFIVSAVVHGIIYQEERKKIAG